MEASSSAQNVESKNGNNDSNNEYNDNYLSIKPEKSSESIKEKRSRPLTSKGKRKLIRSKNNTENISNDAIAASGNHKDSEEESCTRPLTISDASKKSRKRKGSQEKTSQFDSKSTTIIIHDKDVNTDNLHISVYKKRKDNSNANDSIEANPRKFSGRGQKDLKSSERIENQIYSHNDSRGNSRRKRARTKKHHTGSEILLKESNPRNPKERNVSVEIAKNKSIAELYKGPAHQQSMNIKKKSIQYSMKRSRINDLLK